VFKLDEVDRRMQVVTRGMRAIDLGCAPGSWSMYLSQQGVQRIVGVDLQPCPSFPGIFLGGDVMEVAPEQLLEVLGGPADLLVSDMAPSTMGSRFTDHVRQVALARRALDVARQTLRPGGHFVVKVFEGEEAFDFVTDVRRSFAEVRRIKPESTRKGSVEFFVGAKGFRPLAASPS